MWHLRKTIIYLSKTVDSHISDEQVSHVILYGV